MSVIIFLIGLFVLFKGSFRLAGRSIAFAQSRLIALLLMAPLVLSFCASFLIFMNNPDLIVSIMSEDGNFNASAEAFSSIANLVGTIELISVIAALALVAFNLYNAPKIDAAPAVQRQPFSSASTTASDIMTVAEAAAYMRLSESEVLSLIEEGKLGAAKIGTSYRIARIAIDDFMGLA